MLCNKATNWSFIHILGCIRLCMLFILSFSAPTRPRMFRITSVMTRSLSFSWQRPETLNGNLTGYQLFCQPLLPGIPSPQILNTTAVIATVSGLYPGVEYNCSIVARNSAGPSDPDYISNTTLETGTLFCAAVFQVHCKKKGSNGYSFEGVLRAKQI